jgi:hypothetical protein
VCQIRARRPIAALNLVFIFMYCAGMVRRLLMSGPAAVVVLVMLAGPVMLASGGRASADDAGRVSMVANFYPVEFLARRVGGGGSSLAIPFSFTGRRSSSSSPTSSPSRLSQQCPSKCLPVVAD